jgi:hypothetical protein
MPDDGEPFGVSRSESSCRSQGPVCPLTPHSATGPGSHRRPLGGRVGIMNTSDSSSRSHHPSLRWSSSLDRQPRVTERFARADTEWPRRRRRRDCTAPSSLGAIPTRLTSEIGERRVGAGPVLLRAKCPVVSRRFSTDQPPLCRAGTAQPGAALGWCASARELDGDRGRPPGCGEGPAFRRRSWRGAAQCRLGG